MCTPSIAPAWLANVACVAAVAISPATSAASTEAGARMSAATAAPRRMLHFMWVMPASPYRCEIALQTSGRLVVHAIGQDARYGRVAAVEFLVVVIVRLDHRTVEGQAAIGASSRRPYDNIASFAAGSAFRRGAQRHHRDTGAGADLERAGFDSLERAIRHDDEDEFGLLKTDLQSERSGTKRVECRRAPAASVALEKNAFAAFGAEDEAALHEARNDQHRLGAMDHAGCDRERRIALEMIDRVIGVIEQFGLVRSQCGGRGE